MIDIKGIRGTVIGSLILITAIITIGYVNKVNNYEPNRTKVVYAQTLQIEEVIDKKNDIPNEKINNIMVSNVEVNQIPAKETIINTVHKVNPTKETISKAIETPEVTIPVLKEDKVITDEISVIEYTDEERKILYRIVEAEAGGEDAIGKCLVANVIINRVKSDLFEENTIKKVVFAKGQFEPVGSGRYYEVKISDETKDAVDRALNGEDYSKGALFFHSTKISPGWSNYKKLFTYGGHVFYKNK